MNHPYLHYLAEKDKRVAEETKILQTLTILREALMHKERAWNEAKVRPWVILVPITHICGVYVIAD